MLNHIIISGRLTRDPELRRTGSGIAVTGFTVAVDRDFPDKTTGQKETDFLDCNAWRHTGEFVARNFHKGSAIIVSGRLQIRPWTDKDGNKRKSAEIVADQVYFGGSKSDSSSYGTASAGVGVSYSGFPETEAMIAEKRGVPDFSVQEGDDSQLPF